MCCAYDGMHGREVSMKRGNYRALELHNYAAFVTSYDLLAIKLDSFLSTM